MARTVFVDDDKNADWPKRTDDTAEGRAKRDSDAAARTAAFDEAAIVRDERGRFGQGDGGADKADKADEKSAVAVGDKVEAVFPPNGVKLRGEIAKFNAAGDAYLINIEQPNAVGADHMQVIAGSGATMEKYREPEPRDTSASPPTSAFAPPELLPDIPSDQLLEAVSGKTGYDNGIIMGEGAGGSTGGVWYQDQNASGDQYLVKEPDGTNGYQHEGTNEVIGSRMLDEVDLVHADVRVAGDDADGNFATVAGHIDNLDGVEVQDTWGSSSGFARDGDGRGSDLAKDDAIRLSMFDQVVQNQDGHGGNFLDVTRNGEQRIAPIDNSLILGGRGDDYGNIGFPDPAPMSEFGQYNGTRHDLAEGIGHPAFGQAVPRETVERVYDETVGQLQAGVNAVNEPAFLDTLPSGQRDWTMNEAVPYMQSQVDALTEYRDENLEWMMANPMVPRGKSVYSI